MIERTELADGTAQAQMADDGEDTEIRKRFPKESVMDGLQPGELPLLVDRNLELLDRMPLDIICEGNFMQVRQLIQRSIEICVLALQFGESGERAA